MERKKRDAVPLNPELCGRGGDLLLEDAYEDDARAFIIAK